MNKIGFLFDLDGVLIDSESEYTRIWTEIDRRYPSGKENFAHRIKGQTLHKILIENYPDEATRKDVSDLLHELEGQMKYRYCKGAERLLDDLRERSLPSAVVTSSDELKMSHLYSDVPEFRFKINEVIDASKVTRSKPDPQGYLLGAEALNCDINHCAVFEDSLQGVKAGRASGAYVVGIIGTKTREELLPFSDVVIDSLDQVDIDKLAQLLAAR